MMKIFKFRKIKLIIVLGLFTFFGFCQDAPSSLLPNITPPAPEAFSITKYGDVPIDEFNGKVNLSVPLYEYKAGQLKLPINVNYNGAGLKVKDIPTQVGINFILIAGGLIAREIRDIPDESFNRVVLSHSELLTLNGADCSNEAILLRTYFDNPYVDTEADIFNFNFAGYSGSFYLDKTLTPKLSINDSELKIKIIGNLYNDKTFLITDPTGVKYFFGGANASEYSSIENISNGVHNTNSLAGGITSFYLYKIEHPIYGSINLEYDTKPNYYYNLNSEWTKTVNSAAGLATNCEGGIPPPSTSYNTTRNYCTYPKFLKKISSPNTQEEIVFERVDFNETILNTPLKTALTSIIIKNNAFTINKIAFNYIGLDDLNNIKRFFLSKIEFNKNNSSSGKNEIYEFVYNDPNAIPDRTSLKIDRLGYFNNQNNLNLIPCFPNDYSLLCPNRNSNFTFASKGVLEKVIYPTKGFTQFEYEQKPHVEKKYTTISGSVYSNATGGLDNEAVFLNGRYLKLHEQLPKNFIDENGTQRTIFEMPIPYYQSVAITLTANTTNNFPSDRVSKAKLKITNLTTNTILYKETFTSLVFNYTFNATDAYKIEIDLQLPAIQAEGFSTAGTFTFDLHIGYHAPAGYGIRLKKVRNFESNSSTPTIKRYYYKPYHRINDIFADNIVVPESIKFGAWVKKCTSPQLVYDLAPSFNIINSTTRSSTYNFYDFTFNNLDLDYATICTSFGGDNFEMGGNEKTFGIEESDSAFKLDATSTNYILLSGDGQFPVDSNNKSSNKSPINGKLLKEKLFVNKNNTICKMRETLFTYSSNYTLGLLNFFGYPIFSQFSASPPVCGGNYNGKTLSNYAMFTYLNKVYDFKKTTEKQTIYIDPIPATLIAHEYSEVENPDGIFPTQEQLEAPYKKLSTTQTYEYGTLKGLPTKITTNTSDNSMNKVIENTYVTQDKNLTGLSTTYLGAYSGLLMQNILATPIEIRKYENSNLLSTQRTLYKQDVHNHILPEIIQIAKGSQDLEDRLVFSEYDIKGNPTIISLKDGTKTKYFYNSLNQVIVKVENYDSSMNIAANPLQGSTVSLLQGQFPTAQISIYNYNSLNNLLESSIAPNGQFTYYEYNALLKLVRIRDHNNNILQEFDHNYKPQN